jgi:hypothetical protein
MKEKRGGGGRERGKERNILETHLSLPTVYADIDSLAFSTFVVSEKSKLLIITVLLAR